MASPRELPWRDRSADERRAERRRRLLEAALDLVDTEGLGAVSVRGICARAQLTSRYFYESFESSQELLSALYDDLAEQAAASALTTLSLRKFDLDRVRESLGGGVDSLEEAAPSIRFLLAHATADPVLNERRRRFVALVSQRMAEASARSHGLSRPPAWLAARARFILGGMIELTTAYIEGEIDRAQLIETLAEQVALLEAPRTAADRRSRSKVRAGQ